MMVKAKEVKLLNQADKIVNLILVLLVPLQDPALDLAQVPDQVRVLDLDLIQIVLEQAQDTDQVPPKLLKLVKCLKVDLNLKMELVIHKQKKVEIAAS